MPKKIRTPLTVPTQVAERLQIWGRAIRSQRVLRHLSVMDICKRMDVSDATLRRIERGDVGVSASTYLTALWVLGLMDAAAPALDPAYWHANPNARARPLTQDDDDYF